MEAQIIRFPAERRIPAEWRGHPSVARFEEAAAEAVPGGPDLASTVSPEISDQPSEAALSIDLWLMGRETSALKRKLARALRSTIEALIDRELSPMLAGTERHPVIETYLPGNEPLLSAADTALEIADRIDEIRNGHGLLGFALGVGAAPPPRPGRESDAIHLASRLREAAPAGAILLGGSSWPEFSDHLLLRRVPELAPLLPGGPVSTFLLEGSVSAPDVRGQRASEGAGLKLV
jgi:hypothetical protein